MIQRTPGFTVSESGHQLIVRLGRREVTIDSRQWGTKRAQDQAITEAKRLLQFEVDNQLLPR